MEIRGISPNFLQSILQATQDGYRYDIEYKITQQLGEGGFGKVMEAKDVKTQRLFAVKQVCQISLSVFVRSAQGRKDA